MINPFCSYITCGCGRQFQVVYPTGTFDDYGQEIFLEDQEEAYRLYKEHECEYMGEGK